MTDSVNYISFDNDNYKQEQKQYYYYSISIEEFLSSRLYDFDSYFSRKYTWNLEKASKFIESILLDRPTQFFISCPNTVCSKEFVIDGYQRLQSIDNFVNDKFRLSNLKNCIYLNSLKCSDLSVYLQNKIKNYILKFIKIDNTDINVIIDIYTSINNINDIEAENIFTYVFNRDLNDMITEMSSYKEFKKIFEDSNIDLEERKEYIIRFLAFYENYDMYNGNINEFKKNYIINSKNNLTDEKKRKLILLFENTIDACLVIFKDDAFRNCINFQTSKGIKKVMYKSISKPVFEMQMLGVAGLDFAQIYRNAPLIKKKYEEMLNADSKFRPYYKKMSNRAIHYRVNLWRKIIQDIIKY